MRRKQRQIPRHQRINKRESDKFVRANSDSDDDDRDLKWSDAPDWTCPTWPGDVVPKDPEPWLKLIKGENLPTQRATLLRSLDAVCAWHPFSSMTRLSNGKASIEAAIDDFVAHGLPLQRHKHPKYRGSRKHPDNEGIGKAGSVAALNASNAKKHVDFAAARAEGVHLDPWGNPVDPDKATKAQEHNFLRRQAGDDVHRQFGLSTMPKGRELTALLRAHQRHRPPWDDPVRDFATQIIPFADLGGKVHDHRWWDHGQQRTCPTSSAVNAGPLPVIDFLVRCGATVDDVADFATSTQGWLGRAGGAKPRYDTFLGAPEKAAPAGTTVRTLRSAPVPKERELSVCASTPMPDGWRLPEIAVVVVDVLASSRDVGTAGICEISFDVLGAGDQHVSFSSVSIPRGAITYEAYLGHGFTKTMLMKAGAPELGEVLKEASSFLNGVLGERRYVFCAYDAREFVAPLLGRLSDELGYKGFSTAAWVDLVSVACLVAPAGERRSTDPNPYSLAALYTTATGQGLAPQCSAYRRARAVGHVLTWLVRMANVGGDWKAAWYRFLDAFHQSPDSRLAADVDAADPDPDADPDAETDLDEGAGDPTRIDMRRRAVVRDVVSTRFALRLFAPRGSATTAPALLDDDDDDDNASSRRKRARTTTPDTEQPAPEPRLPGAISPPREPRDRAVAASGVDPRLAILDHASAAHAAATEALALLPVGDPSELPVVDLDSLSASAHAEFLLSVASSFEAKCRAAATVVEE